MTMRVNVLKLAVLLGVFVALAFVAVVAVAVASVVIGGNP